MQHFLKFEMKNERKIRPPMNSKKSFKESLLKNAVRREAQITQP